MKTTSRTRAIDGTRQGSLRAILGTVLLLVAATLPLTAQTWFDPDSFWRTPIGDEPISADQSDALKLYQQWRYDAAGNDKSVTAPNWRSTLGLDHCVYTASATEATIRVKSPAESTNSSATDYYMDPIWQNVPWPSSAVGTGPDGHCVIYQPSTNKMWEFWVVSGTYPNIVASWGGYLGNVTHSDGILPNPYGATATGLPLVGGMITLAEAAAIAANPTSSDNLIPHVLCINLPQVDSSGHWAPATRNDGQGGPHAIREGRRFRLPATVAVPSGPPLLRAAVIAARDYGMVVRDCTGQGNMIAFLGEKPKPTDTSNWTAIISPKAGYNVFDGFPWDQVQVMDPVSGWGLVDGERYQLLSAPAYATGESATVTGGMISGAGVTLKAFWGGTTQLWTAKKQTDGTCKLYPSSYPSTVLSANGSVSGSAIQITTDNTNMATNANQRWSVGLEPDGSYRLGSLASTSPYLVLNATGTAENAAMNIFTYWGNQPSVRWYLIRHP